MIACLRGNLKVIAFLLDSDCDKEHYNGAGENTLHKACQVGSLDAVRLLVAAGYCRQHFLFHRFGRFARIAQRCASQPARAV